MITTKCPVQIVHSSKSCQHRHASSKGSAAFEDVRPDSNRIKQAGLLPVDGAKVVQKGRPDAVRGVHGRIAVRLGGVADGVPCAFGAPSCGDTSTRIDSNLPSPRHIFNCDRVTSQAAYVVIMLPAL